MNNRSQYGKISDFSTLDNNGYTSVPPDGQTTVAIPLNDKVAPYPLARQDGYLVLDPVALDGQHFQD